MHLSDLKPENSSALAQRIAALGGAATTKSYAGSADIVVDQVIRAINPAGLHLAFLDPFNLAQLPFSIIERMLMVRRMDLMIHVSLQDLQRNLDQYTRERRNLRQFCAGLAQCRKRATSDGTFTRCNHRVLVGCGSFARDATRDRHSPDRRRKRSAALLAGFCKLKSAWA
jgi:three-Cys-motif partner protein